MILLFYKTHFFPPLYSVCGSWKEKRKLVSRAANYYSILTRKKTWDRLDSRSSFFKVFQCCHSRLLFCLCVCLSVSPSSLSLNPPNDFPPLVSSSSFSPFLLRQRDRQRQTNRLTERTSPACKRQSLLLYRRLAVERREVKNHPFPCSEEKAPSLSVRLCFPRIVSFREK